VRKLEGRRDKPIARNVEEGGGVSRGGPDRLGEV
jgi:hypothetical protein